MSLQNGQFDVVLCSDVVWVEYLVPYLVQTMAGVLVFILGYFCLLAILTYMCVAALPLTADAKIIFAHQTRSTRIDNMLFEKLREHGFVHKRVPNSELHPDFKKDAVCLMQIHRA
jgi:hypothetical protein